MADESASYNVLFVGHSLMVGITGTAGKEVKGEGFVGSVDAGRVFGDMARKLGIGIKADVAARTSSSIAWSQGQLDQKKPGQFGVIVVYTGDNDLSVGKRETLENAADRVIEGLAKLYYTAAKTLGAKNVFIFSFAESADPKKTGSGRERLARAVNNWLRENIPSESLIDVNSHSRADRLRENWKGVHPNTTGYQIMREILRERFEDWHKKRTGTKAEAPPRELSRIPA